MTQLARAKKTRFRAFCTEMERRHVSDGVDIGKHGSIVNEGERDDGGIKVYLVDLGAELLEDVRPAAEVVEDAAGDEEHDGGGEAVADGADEPKHHERHVSGVGVHEHRRERPQHRRRLLGRRRLRRRPGVLTHVGDLSLCGELAVSLWCEL